MNTIHDVLRFILSQLRNTAPEAALAQAFAAVDAHERAHGNPDAEPAPAIDPGMAQQLAQAQARVADLEAQLAATPPPPPVPPVQGGF